LEELATMADWDSMPALLSIAKNTLARLKYHKDVHDRIAKVQRIFENVA
jgi:hypothetical protein